MSFICRGINRQDVWTLFDHKDKNRHLGRQKTVSHPRVYERDKDTHTYMQAVRRRGAEAVKEEFCDRNPQYFDIIEEIVQTPYMSFEISDRSDLSDQAREQRLRTLQECARLTQQEIDRKVKVLEKVSLTWRSRAVGEN